MPPAGAQGAWMRADNIRGAKPWVKALLLRPERRFWLIVGLITLGGGALRVLVHDYGLPWIHHSDQVSLWLTVQGQRELLPPDVIKPNINYPPLFLWLHHLVQRWAEAQGRPLAADAILDLRRLILLFNVAGTLWSAMLGRRCGGALAGILAALLWAFTEIMLEVPTHALGESLAYPLLILSLLLAVQALEPARRWQLALASLALAALCFLLEYRLLVAFFPGAAALLLRARAHYRPGWRRTMLWAGVGVALALVTGAILLSLLPARFQEVVAQTLGVYLWDLPGLARHFEQALGPLRMLPVNAIALLALLAWLYSRKRGSSPLWWPALLLTAATLLLTLWANSAIRPYFTEVDLKTRHAIPAITLLFVLAGAALAQIVAVVPGRRLRALAATGLSAYLLLLLIGPAVANVQERQILPWPVIVRPWVDANLEPGTILIYHESERWFNPFWSGIPHRQWFDWLETEDVLERPLQEWIETHKITWLALPVTERDRLQGSDEGRAFLAQLLPLRDFTGPPRRSGIEVGLYRLWRMQQESDVRFGDHIRLVGYDLHDPEPLPGTELALTFYWNAPTRPTVNYSLFLHLVATDGTSPFAQVDGNPAAPERLTQIWDRADETLISPRFTLTLPPDLAPGDYRVLLGLYNFETGARLPLQDAQGAPQGDAWEVTRLRIPDS